MKSLNTLHCFFIFLLLTSSNGNAAIISEASVGSSGANLQGLQWLSFDITSGINRQTIESGHLGLIADGWRYANRSETAILLGSLWGGEYPPDASNDNYSGAHWFLQNFGILTSVNQTNPFGTHSENFSFFAFGDLLECSLIATETCIGAVGEIVDTSVVPGAAVGPGYEGFLSGFGNQGIFDERVGLDAGTPDTTNLVFDVTDSFTDPSGAALAASLLVREVSSTDPDTTNVSEPQSVWLIGIALFGLICFSHKSSNMSLHYKILS